MDAKHRKLFIDLEKALTGCLKAEDTRTLDELIIGTYNTIQEAAKAAKKSGLVLPATLKSKIF